MVKRSVEADDHKFKSASAHFFYKDKSIQDKRIKAYKDIYSLMTTKCTEEVVLVTFQSLQLKHENILCCRA